MNGMKWGAASSSLLRFRESEGGGIAIATLSYVLKEQANLYPKFRAVEKLGKNPFGIKDIHTIF